MTGNKVSAILHSYISSLTFPGRYLKHVATGSLLARSGNALSLVSASSYPSSCLWTIDTSSATSANKNGFFPLQDPNSTQKLQNDLSLSSNTDGVRFITDSSWFSFATQASILRRFIATHGPVFCYADNAQSPLRVEDFITNATLQPSNTPASLTNLLPSGTGKVIFTTPPSPITTPGLAYITVRDSPDGFYVNHSDFTFSLLYSASGWKNLTLRYNNETNNLIAASTDGNDLGWIYNLDSNFATNLPKGANPLRLVKRADGTTRLHVLVTADANPVNQFAFASDKADSDLANWATVVDGGQGILVEAAMVADDENGSGVTPPEWGRWAGQWGNAGSIFIGAAGGVSS